MANAKQLLKRWEGLQGEHELWRPNWQELSDYIIPRRSNFVTQRSPGQKQTELLFDSTALRANGRLAAIINGTLTSRATKWFSLKMRLEELNEDKEVQLWLEECAKRMYRAFNQSTFASEAGELYSDLSGLGTSAMFVEERYPDKPGWNGFIFRTIPLHSFCIDEDAEGKADTFFYTFNLSVQAAINKWGLENLGEKIQRAAKQKKFDEQFMFLHCIYPRIKGIPDSLISKRMPWASVYIDIEDKVIVTEGGFREFPVMVPRWEKTSGEKYGRGPGFTALPDVKTLNEAKKLSLKAFAKALNGPTKSVYETLKTPIKNIPGGNTVVRKIDDLEPLYPPGYFREAFGSEQIKSTELRESIRQIFYEDQLQLPTGPAMTATEVTIRFELLQRILGPTMGNIEAYFLNPLIDRCFAIMLRRGALPEVPEILANSGAQIDVEYEGPLSKSQRLSEVESIRKLQELVAAAATIDPGALDNVDMDQVIRITADALGVPKKIIRDPKEVGAIRADRAEQQQQMQEMADTERMAAAAGKVAPALKLVTQPGAA